MNRFADRFKPISRKVIWFCPSLIIVCLCLCFAEVRAYDREFERIVPDVRGLTIEKARSIVNANGIKNLESRDESTSLKPKGTISRQEPNPGDVLNITRPLKVWVSQPPEVNVQLVDPIRRPEPRAPLPPPNRERLQADIWPRESVVRQGETASFESRSTPRDCVSEEWSGPLDQHGTGSRFEVRTEGLNPGKGYIVELVVKNCHDQKATYNASFEVSAMPEEPEPTPPPEIDAPHVNNPRPPPPLQPHYSASIIADKEKVLQSESVTFTAELAPSRRDVFYRFNFGDGTESDLLRHPKRSVTHRYDSAGKYEAFVKVFDNNDMVIAQSRSAEVDIQPTNTPAWVWIGTALLGGIGAGYIIFRPKPRLRVKPGSDGGSQSIDGDISRLVGPEICLVPVSDMGKQEILEQQTPFIREERWENE